MPTQVDITGKRFRHLVALSYSILPDEKLGKWLCRCDCGNEKRVSYRNLVNGTTGSCGCKASKLIDYTGQQINDLYVIKRAPDIIDNNLTHVTCWLCRCKCGNEEVIRARRLTTRKAKHCSKCKGE